MGDSLCYICHKTYRNQGMTRHIKSCAVKNAGYEPDAAGSNACFLIHVTGLYNTAYSLHLMADGCVRLEELDQYLRDIWLECCGHLSHFQIEGEYYESSTDASYEQDMKDEIGELFYPGLTLNYEYDFGSTTYLTLRVIGAFKPSGEERGIRLLARNKPVKYECEHCEKVAEFQYFNPYDGECGIVCSSCKNKMEQENEEIDFSDCINSPRAGVCAYDGPADDIPFMRHTPSKRKKKTRTENRAGTRDSKDMLSLIENLMSGNINMEEQEPEQILKHFIDRFMSLRGNKKPFVLPRQETPQTTFSNCLMLLKKHELDFIRKQLTIRGASNIKKQALAERIEEYVRQNFREILEYMAYDDFLILREISQTDSYAIDEADESSFEAIRYLLRKGLIFAIEHPLEKYELFFPLKTDFLQIVTDPEFLKKREVTKQIEKCIDSIFFYWGVAELEEIMKETARLLEVSVDEAFSSDFHKIISYMDDTLKYEVIGYTRYYYIFSNYPAEQIISNTWQQSSYPVLSMDMIPEESGLDGLVMHHLHFRLLYELLYELYLENAREESDEELDETDEEICHEDALCTMAPLVETIVNAKPEMSAEQLFKELDLPDYFWEQKEFVSFFNDLKNHVPNYWLKGNTTSGKIYFADENFDRIVKPQSTQAINGNTPAQSAAERWKVGRNDPCPCGSGKKYKKCCLNKMES